MLAVSTERAARLNRRTKPMDNKVEELAQGIRLSLSALSREFGYHRDTIKKRLAQSGVRPDGERNGNAVYRLRDVYQCLSGNIRRWLKGD